MSVMAYYAYSKGAEMKMGSVMQIKNVYWIVLALAGILSVLSGSIVYGKEESSPQVDEFQEAIERTMREFDFASWGGRAKGKYLRPLLDFDVSTVHLKVGDVDVVTTPRGKVGENFSRLFVFAREDRRGLFTVTALTAPDVVTAQKCMLRNFAVTYRGPSDVVQKEIGDRGYGGTFLGGHYVVFSRNNVYVAVDSRSDEYPAESVARQIDELILKQSRAPEKKWWYFFSR